MTCDPYAYTLHLDGRALLEGPSPRELRQWQDASRDALEVVCGWLDEPERLCVENVEAWDPEAFAPVIEALPVSRTIDIGHLWLQGVDPIDHLCSLDRSRPGDPSARHRAGAITHRSRMCRTRGSTG